MDRMDAAPAPRPTPDVARRVEELLREQLYEMGEDDSHLTAEAINAKMQCILEDDGSMTYYWDEYPILFVTPEIRENSVMWRMFTRDDQ